MHPRSTGHLRGLVYDRSGGLVSLLWASGHSYGAAVEKIVTELSGSSKEAFEAT